MTATTTLMASTIKNTLFLWLATSFMLLPFVALRLDSAGTPPTIITNWGRWGLLSALLLVLLLLKPLLQAGIKSWQLRRPQSEATPLYREKQAEIIGGLLALFALLLPLWAGREYIDVATLILTYIMLGWGLNIVTGLAGLLDLGYVAFFAVGAYGFALLSAHFGLSFWQCLPLAGLLAAAAGILLGAPVLGLRGDYFAIVTLGFGEMVRLIAVNWSGLTGGPDGISNIPRPSFFGLAQFTNNAAEGSRAFHEWLGIEFSSLHRVIFLYYLILALALLVNWFSLRIRKQPLGRAWEAFREDDIACRSLGLSRTRIKLSAFAVGAMFGGFAGAFFAARQGFVSPESFEFMESAMILAIVVLGGMGSQLGIVLAASLLVGLPEMFRDLAEYRMLAFGCSMVVMMLLRPSGLAAKRAPSLSYAHWLNKRG
ncbi:MAG: high-affinity branched-chain amino acid ABC transporter permease LivM [Alphaproteobacteria bacterium]